MPAYLATSPISPSSLSQMEAGLAALKAASVDMSVAQDDAMTPVVEHSGTIVTVEDGKVVVSGIPPSATLVSSAVVDERQYFSDSEVPCGSSTGRRRRHVTVATQTQITSSDVDYIRNDRCATPPGEWYSNLSSTKRDNSAEDLSESAAVRVCDPMMADRTPTAALDSADMLSNRIARSNGSSGSQDKDMSTRAKVEDCQFEMELSDDEAGQGTSMLSLLAESSVLGRCASLPSIVPQKGFDESTDAWAANQYMSTTLNDYTPTTRYTRSRLTCCRFV